MAERAVVMFSGGAGSWGAAKRTVERYDPENTTLLFADTLIEDEDLYRYLEEAASNVGAELVKTAEGRDPWQVFFDKRFLGNTRVDLCSRILKRELMRGWLEDHRDPANTVVVLGFGWEEPERFERAQRYWGEWRVEAPMIDKPRLARGEMFAWLRAEGIRPPRLYEHGFTHNNCGGFCVKAGQAQFELLLREMPERYAYHERREQEFRDFIGKDVAILRDRRGGTTKPLTLKAFRERLEGEPGLFDADDWGGACSCLDNPLEHAA